MTSTELADRVVHEHTELQEYLLQWEAALLRLHEGSPAESEGALEHLDRKSTRLNSSHIQKSRMPSSA